MSAALTECPSVAQNKRFEGQKYRSREIAKVEEKIRKNVQESVNSPISEPDFVHVNISRNSVDGISPGQGTRALMDCIESTGEFICRADFENDSFCYPLNENAENLPVKIMEHSRNLGGESFGLYEFETMIQVQQGRSERHFEYDWADADAAQTELDKACNLGLGFLQNSPMKSELDFSEIPAWEVSGKMGEAFASAKDELTEAFADEEIPFNDVMGGRFLIRTEGTPIAVYIGFEDNNSSEILYTVSIGGERLESANTAEVIELIEESIVR